MLLQTCVKYRKCGLAKSASIASLTVLIVMLLNGLADAQTTVVAEAPALWRQVEYRHLLVDGPQSIHVVSFDLDAPATSLVATVGRGVNGSETLGDMVAQMPREQGTVLAAINGDYFEFLTEPRYRGTLQGLTIRNGELLSGPAGTTFWVDDKCEPHIGAVRSAFTLTWPGGATTPFGLNCSTSDYKSEVRTADVVLYTPSFGASTATENVRELVLAPAPGSQWLPLRPNMELRGVVRAVNTAGNTRLQPGEIVISIARKADAAAPAVREGDVITINTKLSPDFSNVQTAIAGDPLLLKDGAPVAALDAKNRHPRTAVGFAGRRCFLVVVDGRQPQLSLGMSHMEMANIMQQLGCTAALNLDGGGSSTLWWNGRVVNSPSDGASRPVGNALVLLGRPRPVDAVAAPAH